MGKMTYSLNMVFKVFYGVALSIGPGNTIKTQGIEKLPEDIRINLEKWLADNKAHVLERLQNKN